nr:cellulose biosynthesis protein BcsG [Photobacterium arenosum]
MFYFIAKFALYLQGTIDFHPLENIALALFLLLPLRSRLLAAIKIVIAVPAAAWLLHYDSFLPPLDRLWAQMNQLMHFEWGYLFELAGRFFSFQALLGLFAVGIGLLPAQSLFTCIGTGHGGDAVFQSAIRPDSACDCRSGHG